MPLAIFFQALNDSEVFCAGRFKDSNKRSLKRSFSKLIGTSYMLPMSGAEITRSGLTLQMSESFSFLFRSTS